jgi:HK97 family phage prohead protease
LRRIARTTNGTLTLAEDETGLRVEATLDPADADVAYIAPKLRAGLIDEMSFAFRITSGLWSPDYSEYRIDRFDLHRGDVAIVGFGANPATAGSGLRTAPDLEHLRARLLLASAL